MESAGGLDVDTELHRAMDTALVLSAGGLHHPADTMIPRAMDMVSASVVNPRAAMDAVNLARAAMDTKLPRAATDVETSRAAVDTEIPKAATDMETSRAATDTEIPRAAMDAEIPRAAMDT